MNRYKPVANSMEEARLEFDNNNGVEPSHTYFNLTQSTNQTICSYFNLLFTSLISI